MSALCRLAPMIDCAGPGTVPDLPQCGESCRGPVDLTPEKMERVKCPERCEENVRGITPRPVAASVAEKVARLRACRAPSGAKSELVYAAHAPEPAQKPRNTKPAAPPPAREEKRMATTCPRCERETGKAQHVKGRESEGKFCLNCAPLVRKCDREGRPVPPFGSQGKNRGARIAAKSTAPPKLEASPKPPAAPRSAPAPAAPKAPGPKPIAQQGATPATEGGLSVDDLVAALQEEVVTLIVRCSTIQVTLAVVAAAGSENCAVKSG